MMIERADYDYRNRVYSATLGRFLQTDPIRLGLVNEVFHLTFNHQTIRKQKLLIEDVNMFRYVRNQAITLSDPMGLSWLQTICYDLCDLLPCGVNSCKRVCDDIFGPNTPTPDPNPGPDVSFDPEGNPNDGPYFPKSP
jgi:RHS repeat-associated protein